MKLGRYLASPSPCTLLQVGGPNPNARNPWPEHSEHSRSKQNNCLHFWTQELAPTRLRLIVRVLWPWLIFAHLNTRHSSSSRFFHGPRHLLKVCKHTRHMPDTHYQPITLAYSRQFYNVLTTSAYFLLLSSKQPLGQSCAQNKTKLILQEQYAAHQMHKMIDLHEIGKIGKY